MDLWASRRRAADCARFALLAGVLTVALVISIAPARAVGCDLYASPSGSDEAGTGSLASPFLTFGKLDQSLSPGQTGCLRGGTYGSIRADHYLNASGSAGAPVTVTAAPGEHAKVVGFVQINGSYTTLSGLEIDGSNVAYSMERSGTSCPYPVSNGLEINGDHVVFEFNDFYQSVPSLRGNGIGVGWNGTADGAVIRFNRIHDVGQCLAYDHLIYLARGRGAQIYDNWLWNDPHGWAVQVYPSASDARIYNNVVDAAGSGFFVGQDPSVSGNVIEHNVVVNSTGLPDAGLRKGVGVSDWWSGQPGTGNAFQNNDVWGDPGGVANGNGITVVGNVSIDPRFVDGPGHDYRLAADSQLGSWPLWNGALGAPGSQDGNLPRALTIGNARAHAAQRATHRRHHHRRRHHHHRHHRRSS